MFAYPRKALSLRRVTPQRKVSSNWTPNLRLSETPDTRVWNRLPLVGKRFYVKVLVEDLALGVMSLKCHPTTRKLTIWSIQILWFGVVGDGFSIDFYDDVLAFDDDFVGKPFIVFYG